MTQMEQKLLALEISTWHEDIYKHIKIAVQTDNIPKLLPEALSSENKYLSLLDNLKPQIKEKLLLKLSSFLYRVQIKSVISEEKELKIMLSTIGKLNPNITNNINRTILNVLTELIGVRPSRDPSFEREVINKVKDSLNLLIV
jgi:hypothetical protein